MLIEADSDSFYTYLLFFTITTKEGYETLIAKRLK